MSSSGVQLTENLIKTLDGTDGDELDADAFLPAPGGFQGPRDGYKFQNGEKGVGYYKEEFAAFDDDTALMKRRKTAHETATTTTAAAGATTTISTKIDYDKMLAEIEQNNPDITKETTELTVKSVRKLVIQFERKRGKESKVFDETGEVFRLRG